MTTGPFTSIEAKPEPDKLTIVQEDLAELTSRVRRLENAKLSFCQQICKTVVGGSTALLAWLIKREFT
jgi:hypothetical protein